MSADVQVQPGGPPAAVVRWIRATVPLNSTTGYDQPGNMPFISTSGIRYFDVGDQVWANFAFNDWKAAAFPGATLTGTFPEPSWFHIWRIGV